MKNIFRVLVLLVIVFCFEISAGDAYKIGAAVYGLKAEYMKLWVTALEMHPAVKNGMVKITVFDGRYDASVQQSQFETMVSQGYDAIIFVPIDIEAGKAAIEIAAEENVPVIGSNTRVDSDLLTSYIGSSDTLAGEMEANAVIKELKEKGNVVILEGPIGQSSQIERLSGNLAAINKYPNIKILENKTANWSRAESLSLVENWLTSYPNKIQGIIGQNDEMALGAIQAIKAFGLNPKDFVIVGIDGVSDALAAVKNGEMKLSILQDATAQAQGALDLALRTIIGEEYKPMAECWKKYPELKWGDSIQKIYNVPWTIVTQENVEEQIKIRQELTVR